MKHFFLNLGLSWTLSKILPYIIWTVVGVVLWLFVSRRLEGKWMKLLSLLILPVPFLIYFIFSPIYEGDFSNTSRERGLLISRELEQGELTLLAMPGCPYCYDAIDVLKVMKERTASSSIRFRVVTKDATAMDWYKEKVNGAFPVEMVTSDSVAQLARGYFPTYVYTTSKGHRVWSSDQFGVGALDWLEEQLKK